MNTKNNKRRRESQNKIERSFVNMLLTKNINKISVTDICKETGLNRTTFYANYIDIYDLADKIRQNIERYFGEMFSNKQDRNVVNFFRVIYNNQIMFNVYFKLVYDNEFHTAEKFNNFYINENIKKYFKHEYTKYHIAFFQAGLNALIKMWLDNGCKETPEEMAEIIKSEYIGRNTFFS